MMPFIDLAAQLARISDRIDAAVRKVVASGAYVMGPEVFELEKQLAAFCGAKHCISCASGTDALTMVLLAKGVGPGIAVLCPSFTFAATAEAVALLGGTPFFVDVQEDTFNMDPASLEAGVAEARAAGLNPVGVIAVDLFGQPADYESIEKICSREKLWRELSRPQARDVRPGDNDQLLPGQTARRLWRRRRDLHR
jgi:dTDP-4-amino-4,6-dideoxygalactose transaminase